MRDVVRQALAVMRASLGLGNEVFEAEGATFVRNTRLPALRDGNHVTRPTAVGPAAVEAVLEQAEREFAGSPHRRFDCDDTTPPPFEARLARDPAFARRDVLVMLLADDLRGPLATCPVRAVADAAGWRALAWLEQASWAEATAGVEPPPSPALRAQVARARRAKVPPFRYFLAWLDGDPVGYFSAWEGIEGVGQVEDLFVLPAVRGRGIGSALLRRCVAECRAHGAGAVVLAADPEDRPRTIYAARGFRPIALRREYLRVV